VEIITGKVAQQTKIPFLAGLEDSQGGGGYAGFQVMGMIEWGGNQNPKSSQGLPTKPKNITGPKFNPIKSHAGFPSLEH